ncbi:MAG: IS1595 family transposase [Pseudomonadota bacterium]
MNLIDPIFTDANAAREYLERSRWADGVFCPHCGGLDRIKKLEGKSHRPGLYQCGDCRKQFTVTVGTVFERSKVPLNKWLLATHLMASSKKGISAHQLHRSIGVTHKTAWFMFHRIREAMRTDNDGPMGSGGGEVEIDETFIGRDKSKKPVGEKKGRGYHHKYKVLSPVDRTTGKARSVVVDDLKQSTLLPILRENVSAEATGYTDEAGQYTHLGAEFETHEFVRHRASEWGRGTVHTNTIEGYFSIFKRGMKGVYQHCGRQHLQRYIGEFEFRCNNRIANGVDDTGRALLNLKGAEGKRSTYRRTDARASA